MPMPLLLRRSIFENGDRKPIASENLATSSIYRGTQDLGEIPPFKGRRRIICIPALG